MFPRHERARLVCCLGLALGSVSATEAAKSQPFPYTLVVEVGFAEEGPETLREELEAELLRSLQHHRCFSRLAVAAIGRETGAGDLGLRVEIQKLVDETSFDLSIAERYAPDAPPDAKRQLTTWIEADVAVELRALPEGQPVRSKWFRVKTGYRPRVDEDPRLENQIQAIDEIVRTARGWACNGSAKKLEREIAAARAAARPAGDRSP